MADDPLGLLNGAADDPLGLLKGNPKPQEEPSIAGEFGKGLQAGIQQIKGMGYGLAAVGGEAIGSEKLTEIAREGLASVEAATPKPAVGSFKDIGSISDVGKYLSYGVASNLPNLLLSFAGGGAGAVIGKQIVGSAAKKAIVDAAIKRGALAGAGMSSLGMETGSIAGDQLTEAGKVDIPRALASAIPAAALDIIPEWYLAKRLGWLGDVVKEEGGRAVRALKVGGKQFLMEAPTEAMQSALERSAVPGKSITNQEAWDEYINSFILGGVTGGVVGAGGGLVSKMKTDVHEQAIDKQMSGDEQLAQMRKDIESPVKEAETAKVDKEIQAIQPEVLPPLLPPPAGQGEGFTFADTTDMGIPVGEPYPEAIDASFRTLQPPRQLTSPERLGLPAPEQTGEGFTFTEPPPKAMLRKAEPSYTAGTINENLQVEYKPIVTKSGTPFKSLNNALKVRKARGMKADEYDIISYNGGYAIQKRTVRPAPKEQQFEDTEVGKFTLGLMLDQLRSGSAGLTYEGGEKTGLVTGRFSSHADWFRKIADIHDVSAAEVAGVLKNKVIGKTLTEKQFNVWNSLRKYAVAESENNPMVAQFKQTAGVVAPATSAAPAAQSVQPAQPTEFTAAVESAPTEQDKNALLAEEGAKRVPGIPAEKTAEAGQFAYFVDKGELTQQEFDAWAVEATTTTGKKMAPVIPETSPAQVTQPGQTEQETDAMQPPAYATEKQGAAPGTATSANAPEIQQRPTLGVFQSIFANSKIEDKGDYLIVTFPSGKSIVISAQAKITPDEIAFEIAYGRKFDPEKDIIAGVFQKESPNVGSIVLVRDQTGDWTVAHEAGHAILQMAATDTEYNLFKKYVEGLAKRGIITPNNPENLGSQEDMADVIADLRTGRTEKYKPNGMIQRIVNKVNAFIDRIKEAFGLRTTTGVIKDIESGQIFYGKGPNQVSMTAPEQPAYALDRTLKAAVGTVLSTFEAHPEDMPKAEIAKQRDFMKQDKKQSLSGLEYALNIPFRLSQKYQEWRDMWRIHAIDRQENRSSFVNNFITVASPFFEMNKRLKEKGYTKQQVEESKSKIESVLVAGDIELHDRVQQLKAQLKEVQTAEEKQVVQQQIDKLFKDRRYTDEELAAGIKDKYGNTVKLNPDEIEIYTSVRKSLDNVLATMHDWMLLQSLRSYKNQKWFALLAAATDMNLNSFVLDELLGKKGLKAAALAKAKKLQVDVKAVFSRIDEGIATTPTEELSQVSKNYNRIATRMSKSLLEVKKYLGDITGITDEKELNDLTKEVFIAYTQTRPQLKAIKEMRNQMNDWIGYFPRYREGGKYKMRLVKKQVDEDGNLIVDEDGIPVAPKVFASHFIDNTYEGKQVYSQMLTEFGKNGKLPEGYEIEYEKVAATPEGAFEGVTDTNMQKIFDDAMEHLRTSPHDYNYTGKDGRKRNVLEELRNAGYEAIANQFKTRGAMRATIHRKAGDTISGYNETGLDNVLLNYMSSMAGLMTKQAAAMDALDLLKGVKNKSQFEALSKYNKEQLRNDSTLDQASGKLRSMAFLWFLGGLLKAPIINITQNPIVGFAELSKYQREHKLGGAGKADVQYLNAMKDVLTNNLTDKEKAFINKLVSRGVATDQYIQSIFEGVKNSDTMRKYMAIGRWLATPFSMSEVYNRKSAAIAMYRTAYDMHYKEAIAKGMDDTSASAEAEQLTFDDARTFIDNVHYAYGKANRPVWMSGGDITGAGLAAAYTFRGFTHNFLARQQELLSQKDFKTVLHTLAYLGVFGGLMGLPFFKDLFEFMEKNFGFSPTNYIRKSLRDVGGETLEKFGVTGLPSVLGANISGSLATGLPWPIGAPTPESSVFGVWGGLGQKFMRAGQAALRGDLERTITEASPEFLRNPRIAIRESEIGKELFGTPGYATNVRGRPMMGEGNKPIQLSTAEAITKAVGFNPTDYARAKEKNQTILRQVEWVNNAKKDITETFRIAKLQGDPDAMKNMIKSLADLNTQIRTRGLALLVPPMRVQNVMEAIRPLHGARQRREAIYRSQL